MVGQDPESDPELHGQETNTGDDEVFTDSELDEDDLLDMLAISARGISTPYQATAQPKKTSLGFIDLTASTPPPPNIVETPINFEDPSIASALDEAELGIVTQKSGQPRHADNQDDQVITLTRADLESIKRAAFTAGHRHGRRPPPPFPFLSLPAELRLVFYSHYFADGNPRTSEHVDTISSFGKCPAVPERILDASHCCPKTNHWCNSLRPRISTTLLATCKQIYHEARDDFLYKDRHFHAPVGKFDVRFREMRPQLRFWQYIQNLSLVITSEADKSARFETGNLATHLVALLRGGQNLRSFTLRYLATSREESITRFKDLGLQSCKAISLTQAFKEYYEPTLKGQDEKKHRLERLLLGMMRLDSYEAPTFEFVSSTLRVMDSQMDLETWETHMTISVGGK